jgi:hypothetical protein
VTVLGPFNPAVFNAHAADGTENGSHLWVTASGAINVRAIRLRPGLLGNAP